MSIEKKGSKSLIKKILFGGLILLIVGAVSIWYIFSLKFTDTSEQKSDYVVNAVDFIHEFEKSDSLANLKYSEKIITVNGTVSEVEAADTTLNIKMTDSISGSYIIFGFQKANLEEPKRVKVGDKLSIKGSCSGGAFSEILEVEYITFKRSVISK